MIGVIRAATTRVLDIALPGTCVGCAREGPPLCRACEPALDARLDEPAGVPIGMPADIPAPLLQVEWCAPFTGVTRDALHGIKYGGEQRLAEPLGAAIARRWARVGVGAEVVVHVPVHARAAPAARLRPGRADRRGSRRGTSACRTSPRSERERATIAQFDLDRRDRATQRRAARSRVVDDAGVRPAIRGRWVLLVDDVLTTGRDARGLRGRPARPPASAAVSAITVARER